MNRKISKIIALAALAGLVLAGSGCKTVCHSNQKAGYATIVCQPEDVTIEDADAKEPVKFKVVAAGTGLTYRWYRSGQPIDEGELKDHVCGIYSEEIELHGDWKTTPAAYYCVIGSKNPCGDGVQTSTRRAFLNYAPATYHTMSTTPTQTLPVVLQPPSGPPGTEGGFTYCSAAVFRAVNHPTGPLPTSCNVELWMTPPGGGPATIVAATNYYLKVKNAAVPSILLPVNQNAGANTKSFKPNTPKYLITVCCNCSFRTDSPNLFLILNWQQP